MSQFQPIVLKDSALNSHSFKPRDITGNVSTFVESTGVPIGERRISVSITRNNSNRVKVLVKGAFPVLGTSVVNGVARDAVVRTNYFEMSFNWDTSSTAEERDEIRTLAKNFLDGSVNPIADGTVVNLEGIY